jgi:hypothetical protein
MEWLIADCSCFGLRYQNWLPVFVGILVLYIIYLFVSRNSGERHPRR